MMIEFAPQVIAEQSEQPRFPRLRAMLGRIGLIAALDQQRVVVDRAGLNRERHPGRQLPALQQAHRFRRGVG